MKAIKNVFLLMITSMLVLNAAAEEKEYPACYRIALHWPELGMGTFMKIMSTPGNIEDFMLGITELNQD